MLHDIVLLNSELSVGVFSDRSNERTNIIMDIHNSLNYLNNPWSLPFAIVARVPDQMYPGPRTLF